MSKTKINNIGWDKNDDDAARNRLELSALAAEGTESSGRVASYYEVMASLTSSGSEGRLLASSVPQSAVVGEFQCPQWDCGRSFQTLRGLNVHIGKMHGRGSSQVSQPAVPRATEVSEARRALSRLADSLNDARVVRWTSEECRVLAELEFQVRGERGRTVFCHTRMVEMGFTRKYHSVVSKLREKGYLELRETVWEGLRAMAADRVEGLACQQVVGGLQIEGGRTEREEEGAAQELVSGISLCQRNTVEYCKALKCPEDVEPSVDGFEVELDDIVEAFGVEEYTEWAKSVNRYIRKLTGQFKRERRRRGPPKASGYRKRAQKKAWRLLKHQAMWEKNRGRTARDILNARSADAKTPDVIDGFFEHWQGTFERDEDTCTDGMVQEEGETIRIWGVVSLEEVAHALKEFNSLTSNGPDDMPIGALKKFPLRLVVKILNLIVLLERVPKCLKRSKTIFIPKGNTPDTPRDFRPISIASILLRTFNKIIAKRILHCITFDHRQRAFMPRDGCAENAMLLDTLLKESRSVKRPLFIALLDMANAFGSVAHEVIVRALVCKRVDRVMVEYVRDLYRGFETRLVSRGKEVPVEVRRGILQGDPLSPVLFNMVIDQVLKRIPERIGYTMSSGHLINGMAFADDLNAIAETEAGLQLSLNAIEEAARPLGLRFNAKKCAIVAQRPVKKRYNNMVVEPVVDTNIMIGGVKVPTLGKDDVFRYLGAHYNHRGIKNVEATLGTFLGRLRKSSLTVSQKLYVLRLHVLPKFVHLLMFADCNVRKLERLDVMVRKFLSGPEGLLRLPVSTPTDFYYGAVRDGGLGLISYRRSVPAMIVNRFERLMASKDPVVAAAAGLSPNRDRVRRAIGCLTTWEDILGGNRVELQKLNRGRMLEKYDTMALREASQVSYVHEWVRSGNEVFFGGRSFIRAVMLRCNSLPTLSRVHRGTSHPKVCRHGCGVPETNEHIMQVCRVSRDWRRVRHNRVVEVLSTDLIETAEQVWETPTVRLGANRIAYPDLVVKKGGKLFVIDVQVVGDSVNTSTAYNNKTAKYSQMEGFDGAVRQLDPEASEVLYGAIIITRRGLVGRKTEDFRKVLGLEPSVMKKMVLVTISGSCTIFDNFSKTKPVKFFGNGRGHGVGGRCRRGRRRPGWTPQSGTLRGAGT